jgi:hypothetical protein
MSLIRVGGRTYCWVVVSFLRESKSIFRAARKRLFLRARACIPRQNTSTEIEAKVQHTQEAVQHGFQGPYSHLCAQKSRQQTAFNSVRMARIFSPYSHTLAQISRRDRQLCSGRTVQIPYRSVQSFLGTEIEADCCGFFWKVWHGFQGSCTVINAPRKLLKLLARISRHPYSHLEAQRSRSRPVIYCRKF